MAHFLILPVGSHGDVHPFVSLGKGLLARGHRVTMITAEPFRGVAERNGLEFVSTITAEEYEQFINNPDLWNPKKGMKIVFNDEMLRKYLPIIFTAVKERYTPGETVTIGGTMAYAPRIAHDLLGIPHVTVHLQPMSCCSVEDPPVSSTGGDFTWLPRPIIRMAYWAAEKWITDPMIAPAVNDFRNSLGLPPVKRVLTKWAHSPLRVLGFFPEWFGKFSDCNSPFFHAGFVPFDDAGGRPTPAALLDFIRQGDPPVVFSFGSAMRTGRPYFEAAIDACQRLNIRGVLLAKGNDQIPSPLPANVFQADYAPFSEVFPLASCVVHHGGVGTSSQALQAGVPQLVMPMAFDQADNAARMKRLGVSRTLFPRKFKGQNVARELKAILADPKITEAAKRVKAQFHGMDGLAKACSLIEEMIPKQSEVVPC